MQDKAIPRRDRGPDSPSPESEDAAVQRAVLSLSLAAYPKSLTIPGLAREIDQGNAVERAVRDLVGAGLLDCGGITVRPSVAALHFDRLELP
jgi:hypothetical protein